MRNFTAPFGALFFMDFNSIDYEKELNADQLAAVMAPPDRPALVLAGAGAGKTRTLTYRVAWLISECRIKPWRMLLLTFTNKAAGQMLERVEQLTGRPSSDFWSGTFHSMGCKFLRINAAKAGIESNFTILDAEDSLKLLKNTVEAVSPRFFSSKDNPKAGLLFEIISFARNTMSTIAEAMLNRFSWLETPADKIEEIARAYGEAKRASNSCDFDDMLELWYRLLLNNADVLSSYRERFENILVDEYQDTNRLQSAILDLLADRGQLSAVGDDAQCIYSWRGAEIDNILTFKDRYPAANIYKIGLNYRSSPQILAFANQILNQMPTDEIYRQQLVATRGAANRPFVLSALDSSSQARLVCDIIGEIVDSGRYGYSDIAVLYRSHFQAMDMQLQLQYRSLPFVITSGLKFFEQSHIKDVIAQIKFAANPKDYISFHRFARLFEKIGDKTVRKIYDAAVLAAGKKGVSIVGALSDKAVLAKVPAVSREAFSNMAASLEKVARDVRALEEGAESADSSAQEAQMSLFEHGRAHETKEAAAKKRTEDVVKDVCSGWYKDVMMTTYEDYPERAKDFDALAEYASKYPNFEDFLANVTLEVSQAAGQSADTLDRIRLMTVHQAKGLEFPVVFVIGAADGLFPTNRSIEDGDVEEERRLFYVATTRAMDMLIITYPKVSVISGEVQMRSKSRFLENIPQGLYVSKL